MCNSLLTNTVVQTYNTGKPVWSCCWCLDNSNYVYAGLSNGSVLVYDTRDTSTHVQELEPLRSRSTTHPPQIRFRLMLQTELKLTVRLFPGVRWRLCATSPGRRPARSPAAG